MRKGLLFAKRTITLAKRMDVCIVVSRRTLNHPLFCEKDLKIVSRKDIYHIDYRSTCMHVFKVFFFENK